MLIALVDAVPATCGAKAATLARLLQAGFPVPPGFVVPTAVFQEAVAGLGLADAEAARRLVEQAPISPPLLDAISHALMGLAGPSGQAHVAVRSSATNEDTADATAAGQHDTFLAVSGSDRVADAVRRCWASLWSERAVQYRRRRAAHGPAGPAGPPAIAVLVQVLVDADAAGVMFTGTGTGTGTGTDIRLEASWGLGESVVSGRITPDSWFVSGQAIVHRVLGVKDARIDREQTRIVTSEVPPTDRERLCLNDNDVLRLARLGNEIAELMDALQDIEWAIADGRIWILQARPVTTALPAMPAMPPADVADNADNTALAGTPGSPGIAAGPARLVRGPNDFAAVRPGDVLVCQTTDPAWTPLFGVVAAVVTETGGLLSHAAIVARELGLPAVLAVADAMTTLTDGAMVEVDGSNGWVKWRRLPAANPAGVDS